MPTSHGVRERGNQPWKKAQERKTGSTSGILTEQPSREINLKEEHQSPVPRVSSPDMISSNVITLSSIPFSRTCNHVCRRFVYNITLVSTYHVGHTERERERSWNYCISFSPAKFVWFTYSVVERNRWSGDHLLLSVYKKGQNNGQHLQKKEVAQPSPEFFATEWGTSGALYPSILPSLDYHTP